MLLRRRKDEPVVSSLLDTDFYKYPMHRLILERYGDVETMFRFVNRTRSVRLADHVDLGQLREELDHVRTLRHTRGEIHYLAGTREYENRMMFPDAQLDVLGRLQLPEYELSACDGDIELTFSGLWHEVTFWETIALPIVNELYYEHLTRDCTRLELDAVYAEGVRRLLEKVRVIKEHPDLTFADFGTRRRFSQRWQRYVDEVLAAELGEGVTGQFRGTSCVKNAMDLNLMPIGTNAHELPMVIVALASVGSDEDMREASRGLYRDWWRLFGHALSIALPDTFGTDAGFEDLGAFGAREWKGHRADSLPPKVAIDRAMAWYASHDVDARPKLIVPSDGLTLPVMLDALAYRPHEIKRTFGWGTNLTNDLGFPPLSSIIKAVSANGIPCVKRSDNLAKAMGPAEVIARYARVFGPISEYHQACTY